MKVKIMTLGGSEYHFPEGRRPGYLPNAYAIKSVRGYDVLFEMGRGFTVRDGKIVEWTMSIDLLPKYGGTPMTADEQAFADYVCGLR